jgi:STE24 endopeptidase
MNIYAIIIVCTLVLSYVLDLAADILNLRALQPELPEEFQDVYDAEAYRQAQEYERVNTRFGFVTSTFSLVITLGFWFAGGFNWLDQLVRSWDLHPIVTGLFYIGILVLARTLLSLPFSLYATFVIEERFGFNKTTPRTFVLDLLKSLGLSIVIGGPLLAGLLAFFQYTGAYAWLYCWAVTTVVMLVLQFIAPTWIMPLFNKFTPLEGGELRDRILAYAESVHFPVENLFVMDGSRRSSKSNAFFTGFGKHKRIALFDTLIEKHTIPELVAVLAHEIGHYKKKHVLQGLAINIVHTGIMFFLLSVFLSHQGLFDAFYMKQTSIYAGFIFFGMLYTPIELILSMFLQIWSRRNEYEADRFAVNTFEAPGALADALKKLSRHNLSNLTPHPFYVFLHYSHPPLLQRLRAIRAAQTSA